MLSSCFTNQHVYSPNEEYGSRSLSEEAGKCYAKVFSPSQYESHEETIYKYTGDDPHQEGIKIKERIISEAMSRRERRKVDGDCLSANPNDCLEWYLVQIPEVRDTSIIVVDTILIKDFELENVKRKKLVANYKSQWLEVLCEKHLTNDITLKITSQLYQLGFLGEPTVELTSEVMRALQEYQIENGLGSGALTFETLDHLNIAY